MRFTITPLGAAGGKTPDQIAAAVVEYLIPSASPPAPQGPAPGTPTPNEEPGPSEYYADRGNEPGRWIGLGAKESALVGDVDPEDFARVLAGRDPRTGTRLITARGSAGRRPTLGVGTATRQGSQGEPLYDERDAAAALGLAKREGEHLVDAGERAAMRALLGYLSPVGNGSLGSDPPGSYLVPVIDADGSRWIGDTELSRCEAARTEGPGPEEVEAAGLPDDSLSIAEAARLAGVTARYLQSLCRRYERHSEVIDAELTKGTTPARAYLIGHRGTNDQWRVFRADLVEFLHRRTAPAVRVGYDLTLTTEKSLGVLAHMGEDDTARAVLEAIQAGNDVGLAYLEANVARARARGEEVGVRGLTVASFQHLTSRALDPFPHHHNVVANTVVDEHGDRRALWAIGLYWRAGEASALATAEMRHRLTEALGVRWREAHHGGWEIDGIPDEVLREFSQRRGDIEEAVKELETAIGRGATLDELQTIVLKTRPKKRHADPADLTGSWWKRARRLHFSPRKLAATTVRRAGAVPPPPREDLFDRLAAPDGLTSDSSIFTRGDVIAALADLPVPDETGASQPLLLPAGEVERLADEFITSDHVVELLPGSERARLVPARLRAQGVFTTPEVLAVQRRVLERYGAGLDGRSGTVTGETLREAIADHAGLSAEQQELVARFCTSGHQVQCAIGRAGAGKTTTMRAAVAAWGAAGYRVRGTAVKGEAARILGAATGVRSETLAWYLVQDDLESCPIDARTVLIVDEASTVSDRDLDKLLSLAHATGATVRLIGDPAQHGAVGAGGMFRVLCERFPHHTPELREGRRVQHPHDVAAATALREGRIEEALALLAAAEHLHLVTNEVDVLVGLLRRWWESRADAQPHPMVDRRNRTRRQLNRLAHRLLQATGEVGRKELSASGDRAFSVGDRVTARATNRDLHAEDDRTAYVRNGATGTVQRLRRGRTRDRDRLTVNFDGIGVIEIPRSFFDEHRSRGRLQVGLDHAYALTSYAVQGATFEASTSRIDEHASRSETYVDITRGRTANYLYVTRALDPLDGEGLPKAPPPPLAESVQGRLEASGPERTAVELDPLAAPADGDGRDLRDMRIARGQLHEEDPDAVALRRAETTRARQLARQAPEHLPPDLLARLPGRPETPWLLRHWRRAMGMLTVYRERWKPVPGGGPWEWALGTHPASGFHQRDHDRVAEALGDLALATTTEALGARGLPELPSWARAHVLHLAAAGSCRPDPAALADLYRRVESFREQVGLRENTDPDDLSAVLGPHPPDPRLAVIRAGLAHELGAMADTPPSAALTPSMT